MKYEDIDSNDVVYICRRWDDVSGIPGTQKVRGDCGCEVMVAPSGKEILPQIQIERPLAKIWYICVEHAAEHREHTKFEQSQQTRITRKQLDEIGAIHGEDVVTRLEEMLRRTGVTIVEPGDSLL